MRTDLPKVMPLALKKRAQAFDNAAWLKCPRCGSFNTETRITAPARTMLPSSSCRLMSADHWRQRAATARAQAREMHNLDARQTLLEAAENFDQLAAQAEVRRKTNPLHTSDS